MPRHRNSAQVKQFAKHLGRAVKVVRRARGMKGHALAEDVGVAAANISAIETGKSLPTFGTLQRVAGVLGVSMWQLVQRAEQYVQLDNTMQADRLRQKETDDAE